MKKSFILVILLTVVVYVPSSATIINVPGDYDTIQVAIDNSNNGDTVLVAEGHYYERINFHGKAILLTSEFMNDGDTLHIQNTIIDADTLVLGVADTGSVVCFVNGEDSNSVIQGFTIQNGMGTNTRWGGGIYCNGSGSLISDNIIKNNSTNTGGYGGGIFSGSSETSIHNNIITNNTAWRGAGIGCDWSASIKSNSISNNSADGGGGIFCYGGTSTIIENNSILNNTAWRGSGIWVEESGAEPELTIRNNTIADGNGDGIYCWWFSNANIINNTIINNAGSGIHCERYSGGTISDNIIMGNYSSTSAGGIMCSDESNAIINNNVICDNSGYAGGGICCFGSSPTIQNNTINNNIANDGAGIYWTGSGLFELTGLIKQNTIAGNAASNNGGGIYCSFGDVLIENNSIIQNAAMNGGGIAIGYNYLKTVLTINTILWGNSAPNGSGLYNEGDTALTVRYSNIQDTLWPGEGNISLDPLFDSTYHLTWESYPIADSTKSPCIDAGDPDISYNDPDETRNDMGAYFFPQFQCLNCEAVTLTPEVPNENGTIQWNLTVTNCGSQTISNVFGEIYPTVGDCASGTQYDYNLTRFLTNNLGAGQSFTGRYWYRPILVTGVDLAAIAIDVGPAINNYIASCCFEFYFSYEWGRPNAEPYFGPGKWGEWNSDVIMPGMTALNQNYPNPFNAETNITFDLMASGHVSLKIYNIAGQLVETLVDDQMIVGSHSINWNASAYSSGIYFYKLNTGEQTFTKRMTLLK